MSENIENLSDIEILSRRLAGEKFDKKPTAPAKKQPAASYNSGNELDDLRKELFDLKNENRQIRAISSLNKFGCLKSELVAKDIPQDCDDIDKWVEDYKAQNAFLFRQAGENLGGSFKPSQSNNLSPNEIMNNYIRGI